MKKKNLFIWWNLKQRLYRQKKRKCWKKCVQKVLVTLRQCKGVPQPTAHRAGKDRPNEPRGGKGSHALIRFLPVGAKLPSSLKGYRCSLAFIRLLSLVHFVSFGEGILWGFQYSVTYVFLYFSYLFLFTNFTSFIQRGLVAQW